MVDNLKYMIQIMKNYHVYRDTIAFFDITLRNSNQTLDNNIDAQMNLQDILDELRNYIAVNINSEKDKIWIPFTWRYKY